jgi:hypothetical protein
MSNSKKKPNRHKKKILIFVAIFIIVSVSIAAFFVFRKNPTTGESDILNYFSSSKNVCDEKMIKRYADILKSEDSAFDSSFSKLAKDITSNQNYKNDAECMYILTKYYTYTRDFDSARKSFDGLKTISSDGTSLDPDLKKAAGTIDYSKVEESIPSVQDAENTGNPDGDKG